MAVFVRCESRRERGKDCLASLHLYSRFNRSPDCPNAVRLHGRPRDCRPQLGYPKGNLKIYFPNPRLYGQISLHIGFFHHFLQVFMSSPDFECYLFAPLIISHPNRVFYQKCFIHNSSARDFALRCKVRENTYRLRCIKPTAKRFLHGLMPVTGSRRLNCYFCLPTANGMH